MIRDTSDILKLAYITGHYQHTIIITGKLGSKLYYCLSIMMYKSSSDNKHSAFLSVCHASDNTNNHYGLSNDKHTKIKAINHAIIDSGLTVNNLNNNNLNDNLIKLSKQLNPNLTDFQVSIDIT